MLLSIRMGSDVQADLFPVDECIAAVRMNREAQDIINSCGYFVFTACTIDCKAVAKMKCGTERTPAAVAFAASCSICLQQVGSSARVRASSLLNPQATVTSFCARSGYGHATFANRACTAAPVLAIAACAASGPCTVPSMRRSSTSVNPMKPSMCRR